MTEQLHLLVIDDSEDDRAFCRRTLSRVAGGYDIDEAEDGDSGLAKMEERAFDCVLLDYSLPGRNGVEVLKRVRARHPHVPVVMLTGQGSESVAVAVMREGAQNYIAKSAITADDLHHTIQLAIAHCAMQRRLEQQRASLDLFARALAHDLKEPIRTIKSFLGLLGAQAAFSGRGRDFFDHIQSAADRMAALIDAVHFYTDLDRPVQETPKEPCAGDQVLEEALSDISELVRESQAVITAAPLPTLFANPLRLRQVLQNLLCNAVHHAQGQPRVHVDAVEEADAVVLRVSDNGPGVEAAMRERIFQPFTRLNRRKGGLGLGLAICKRIVDSHGGEIGCGPGADGGAVFAVRLPKQGPAAAVEPAGAFAARPQRAAGLADVLVVDDNEVDIELVRILLLEEEKLRCNLLAATGAAEALSILRGNAPKPIDLMLLDINMPGTDGFDLLGQLRADEALRRLPVLMCTTSSFAKDIERARDLGAAGYVAKPARLASLRPALARIPSLQLCEEEDGYALRRVA
jgi:signal transduction histidine kinase